MSVQLKPKWSQIRDKPDLVEVSDLLAAALPQVDQETAIIAAQRKDGAAIVFKDQTTGNDKLKWSDWHALQLFTLANGSFIGIGSAAIGYLS